MERGARREEARGLRARAAAAPRDPQPASAGARAADARARAAPAPPAGSGSRAEAPLAAPPSVFPQRPPEPQPREQRQQPPRAPPRRRAPHRTAAAGPRERGEEGGKELGEKRTEEPRGEGGGHPHPPASPSPLSSRRPAGGAARVGALPHGARHRLARTGGCPARSPGWEAKGTGGKVERRGAAEAPSLPASKRAPVGEEGEDLQPPPLIAALSPARPPHAGSIATNMAAAQSPSSGREAMRELARPEGGRALCSPFHWSVVYP
ncbi:proline-rich protein 2-like [Hirundo rustica]|uniref:proline-rich protein 2-like n=1 Tax=Hirundo rustica TaxID=43150 RepID=UPI001A95154B|nr:proline-rich protein 2-like [Hirundo rustica]